MGSYKKFPSGYTVEPDGNQTNELIIQSAGIALLSLSKSKPPGQRPEQ
jgi:hypothetical protein